MLRASGFYSVSESATPLEYILKNGGFAIITVGEEMRQLRYTPSLDGPTNILPWPLSLLQPGAGCTLVFNHAVEGTKGMVPGDVIRRVHYKRSERATAIRALLHGSGPDDLVYFGSNI